MRCKKMILPVALLLCIATGQMAQARQLASQDKISAIALPSPNRIILRWAPASARAWHHANQVGYFVERVRVAPNGESDPTGFRRLAGIPLLPWNLEQWKQRVDRNNVYAGIAVQALYGKSFMPRNSDPFARMTNMADDFQNRHGFSLFAADMNEDTATGMGLRFEDSQVSQGNEYLYRIYMAKQPANFRIDTAFVLVKAESIPKSPPPEGLKLTQGDGQIQLAWDIDAIGSSYSGFWVQRSDNGRTYKNLHERPLVALRTPENQEEQIHFIDTTVVNYKKYKYRVYGITPFATMSLPAEISGFARDLTPPPSPVLTNGKHLRESSVMLRWKMESAPRDLRGFRIGISNQPNGPFEVDLDRLLPPRTRAEVDSRALSGEKNYYVIVAEDTAGNASASMPLYVHLIDSIPPAAPVGLTGKADSTGRVTIRWRRGNEPDLHGYRVFMANQEDHEFNLLTGFPVRDTVFVERVELETLTRYVYYKIVALDHNYNPSPPSKILGVRLPDIVPPVTPVFNQVTPTDSSVVLSWIPSSSKDVRQQFLFRRVKGMTQWDLLEKLGNDVRHYQDDNVQRKVMYEYTLQAQDASGLRSPLALPVRARPYDTGKRPGIVQLRARPDTVRKAIRLSWRYPEPAKGQYWFVVYRSVTGEPLARYRSAGKKLWFEDKDTLGWEKFRYAVQVIYRDGGKSALSAPVEILYRRKRDSK